MAWLDRLSSTFKRQRKGETGEVLGSKVHHTFKLTLTAAESVPEGYSACRILIIDQKNKHSFVSPAAKVTDAGQATPAADWPASSHTDGSVTCTWQAGANSVQLRGKLKPLPSGGWQQRDVKLTLQLQRANFIGTWMDLGNPIIVNLAAHAPPQPLTGLSPPTSPMGTPLLLVWEARDPKPCTITVHAYLTCVAGDTVSPSSGLSSGSARMSLDSVDDTLSLASSSSPGTPRTSLSGAGPSSNLSGSNRTSGTAATVEPPGAMPHLHSGRVAPSDVPLVSHKSGGGGPLHLGSGRIVPIPATTSGQLQPEGQPPTVNSYATPPIPIGSGSGAHQVPTSADAGSPTASLRSMPPLEVAESEMSTPRSHQFGMASYNVSPERVRHAGDTQPPDSPQSSASVATSMPPLEVGTESAASSFAAPVGMYMPMGTAASSLGATTGAGTPAAAGSTPSDSLGAKTAGGTPSGPMGADTAASTPAAGERGSPSPAALPAAGASGVDAGGFGTASGAASGTAVVEQGTVTGGPHTASNTPTMPLSSAAGTAGLASIGAATPGLASIGEAEVSPAPINIPNSADEHGSIPSPSTAETPSSLCVPSHSTASGSPTLRSAGSASLSREQLAAILQARKASGTNLPRALQHMPHLASGPSGSHSSVSTTAPTAAEVNALSYSTATAGQMEDLIADLDTPQHADDVPGVDGMNDVVEEMSDVEVSQPVEIAVMAQGPAASALQHQLQHAIASPKQRSLGAAQGEGGVASAHVRAGSGQSTDAGLSSGGPVTERNFLFSSPEKPLVGSLDAPPVLAHTAAAPAAHTAAGAVAQPTDAALQFASQPQPVTHATSAGEKTSAPTNIALDVSGPLARLRAANAETTAALFNMESPREHSRAPTVGPGAEAGTDSLMLWMGGNQPAAGVGGFTSGLGGGYGPGGGEGGELSMAALNELGAGTPTAGAANPALLAVHEAPDDTDNATASKGMQQQLAEQVDFGSRDIAVAEEGRVADEPLLEDSISGVSGKESEKVPSQEAIGSSGDVAGSPGAGVVLVDPVHTYATPTRPSRSSSGHGGSGRTSPVQVEDTSTTTLSPVGALKSAGGSGGAAVGPSTPQVSGRRPSSGSRNSYSGAQGTGSGRRASYSAAAVVDVDLQEGMVPFARHWVTDREPQLSAASSNVAPSNTPPPDAMPVDAVGVVQAAAPASMGTGASTALAAAQPDMAQGKGPLQHVQDSSATQKLMPPTPMPAGMGTTFSDSGAAVPSVGEAQAEQAGMGLALSDRGATVPAVSEGKADTAMDPAVLALAAAPIAFAAGQEGPSQSAAVLAQLELASEAVNRMLEHANSTAAAAAAAVARSDRLLAALDSPALKVEEAERVVDEMVGTAQATMAEAAAREAHADRIVAALDQPAAAQVDKADAAVQGMIDTAHSTAAKATEEEVRVDHALAALDQPQVLSKQPPAEPAGSVEAGKDVAAVLPQGQLGIMEQTEGEGKLQMADQAMQEMLRHADSTAAKAAATEARVDREVAALQQPVDAKLRQTDEGLQAMLQQAHDTAAVAAAQEVRVDKEVMALQQPVDAKLGQADEGVQAMLQQASNTAATAAAQELRIDHEVMALQQPVDARLQTADTGVQVMLHQASNTVATAAAEEAHVDHEMAALQQPIDAKLRQADVALNAMLETAQRTASMAAAGEARADRIAAVIQQPEPTSSTSTTATPFEQPMAGRVLQAERGVDEMLGSAGGAVAKAVAAEQRADAVLAAAGISTEGTQRDIPPGLGHTVGGSEQQGAEGEAEEFTPATDAEFTPATDAEGYISATTSWADHMDAQAEPQLAAATFTDPGEGRAVHGTAVSEVSNNNTYPTATMATGGMIGWIDDWVHGLTADLQAGVRELMAVVHSYRAARLPSAAGGRSHQGFQVFMVFALLHRALQLPKRQAVLGLSVMFVAMYMAMLHTVLLIVTRPFTRRQ